MKSVLALAAISLFVVGCSQKNPDIESMNVVYEKPVLNSNVSDSVDCNDNTKVSVNQNDVKSIYFDFDKSNITSLMQENIKKNAQYLKNIDKSIVLEGNADEIGSDGYNKILGLKRASSVKQALQNEGLDVSHVKIYSYGKSNPICVSKDDECRAKNRRVDIVIK